MTKFVKCAKHDEIFKVENGKKHWIQDWSTFVFIAEQMGLTWNEFLAEVETIPLEELRDNYPVGETMLKKTIITIVEGKKPREIFYPDEPESEATIRKMAILGTCLPRCESMWKDLKGTHFYGNRYDWPGYDEAERLGMKVFVNIRDKKGLTEEIIRQTVVDWKDRPGCGGYWCDQLGHEPDICNQPMDRRIWFYDTVRKYDPDKQNHPVMEMFDMTLKFNGYPGWEGTFSDKTHDLLLFDCYPPADWSDERMIEGMENAWKTMISVFPHTHQVIPQINACSYRKGTIRLQYNFWNQKMKSSEFNNPFRGPIGLCYYKDEYVRRNEEMQREIKEVNIDIMR